MPSGHLREVGSARLDAELRIEREVNLARCRVTHWVVSRQRGAPERRVSCGCLTTMAERNPGMNRKVTEREHRARLLVVVILLAGGCGRLRLPAPRSGATRWLECPAYRDRAALCPRCRLGSRSSSRLTSARVLSPCTSCWTIPRLNSTVKIRPHHSLWVAPRHGPRRAKGALKRLGAR